MYNELLSAARAAGVSVRVAADLAGRGGLVLLKGKPVVFLSESMDPADRVEALAKALAGVDLDDVFLSPAARSLIGDAE